MATSSPLFQLARLGDDLPVPARSTLYQQRFFYTLTFTFTLVLL